MLLNVSIYIYVILVLFVEALNPCFLSQKEDSIMSALNWKPFLYGGLASITAECGKHFWSCLHDFLN